MKSKVFVAVFTVVVMSALAIGTVFAQWPAIGTGYAVTTNKHGVDVLSGEEVTAWAGTTDPGVTAVKFIWLDPDKNEVGDPETVSDFDEYTTPEVPPGAPPDIVKWANDNWGVSIRYATSDPFVPDSLGDWAVKAYFLGTGADHPPDDWAPVRATSFNAVPVTPWGPIAISAVFLAALGFFVFRKRSPSLPRIWN